MNEAEVFTFAVTGMHCGSCGLLIDEAVEALDGVARSETDSRRGRTVVQADPTVATTEQITSAIIALGPGYGAALVAD